MELVSFLVNVLMVCSNLEPFKLNCKFSVKRVLSKRWFNLCQHSRFIQFSSMSNCNAMTYNGSLFLYQPMLLQFVSLFEQIGF